MSGQKVFCVERTKLEQGLGGSIPLGFTVDERIFSLAVSVFKESGEFRERQTLESDKKYLQAIVYGIVTDGQNVLGLWRAERKGGNEGYKEMRHNNKIGLACGGHVEPIDGYKAPDFFGKAFLRELSEELVFPAGFSEPKAVGIILYEETLFDSVHLGLIYKLKAERVELPEQGDEYTKVEFLKPERLHELSDRMEGWGKVIGEAIGAGKLKLEA